MPAAGRALVVTSALAAALISSNADCCAALRVSIGLARTTASSRPFMCPS